MANTPDKKNKTKIRTRNNNTNHNNINHKKDGALYPNKELDVLDYYSKVSPYLTGFLKNKKIATKIHFSPSMFILKRGSNNEAVYINDFSIIDDKVIKLRTKHLDEVREELNDKQRLIWSYFPPRKMVEFFYAVNDEGAGKDIERIFIDIDRKNNSQEDAQKVCRELVNLINSDDDFKKMFSYKKLIILWTGNSFHVYIILNKAIDEKKYHEYLSYGEGKDKSFIIKWAEIISDKTKINVRAGHKKELNCIILDSSNTPSGKLARSPFSIHLDKKLQYNGVSVPVDIKDLDDKDLIKKILKINPESVLKNIRGYEKLLKV